ncbi:MAG: AsmA-like C-terminal region-containing protein, partial [Acidobacteriota bacterium]|nr:AsmA-like C-terminal region-containing protein [Acidobacteriota bacterium]
SGTYAFDHADLGVFHGIAGIISAKGEFQGTLGSIETQGTADTPNFEVTHTKHAVPIKTKFNALVDGTTGNVTLRAVEATIVRTPAHLEGTISSKPGEHGKTTAVNITVREGHIDDVLRIFVREDKPPMEGITNFKAHAVLPPGHRPFEKRIMLEGNFVIERARWEKPSRQANVDMLSKRASGKKKEPETEKVTADINGSVVLKEGVAKFSSVSFKIPGAEANMHGEYNLESKKIDFHGDLKTAAPLSEDTTGAKAVLLKPLNPLFRRKHAGAQVPVEMTGTYSDPHFGVVIPAKK